MRLRSLLFVPADSEKKLQKSLLSPADALIYDLEDAVAPSRKQLAREMCAAHLQRLAATKAGSGDAGGSKLFVRINPRATADALPDLAAVVGPGLDGIVLPKIDSVEDIGVVSAQIEVLEVKAGLVRGSVRLLVVATETSRAMLNMAGYGKSGGPSDTRLVGLTWGAEDLATDIGAVSNREADNSLSPVFQMARACCLLAASAAGVAAIDTLYADYRDTEGLAADCERSRRNGFTGRIAIHPDQVDIINRCYTPSQEDLAVARAIVAAFADQPGQGTVGIGGRMYDRPHLVQACRTLALAEASSPIYRN